MNREGGLILLKCRKTGHDSNRKKGEMPERLNGTVSKTVKGAIPSRVQIPVSPPLFKDLQRFFGVTKNAVSVELAYFVSVFSTCRLPKGGQGMGLRLPFCHKLELVILSYDR